MACDNCLVVVYSGGWVRCWAGLSSAFMKGTACSESLSQRLPRRNRTATVCFYQPVFPVSWFRVFMQVSLPLPVFVFSFVSVSLSDPLPVVFWILPFPQTLSLLLQYLLLSPSWISSCTVSLKVSLGDGRCMHMLGTDVCQSYQPASKCHLKNTIKLSWWYWLLAYTLSTKHCLCK